MACGWDLGSRRQAMMQTHQAMIQRAAESHRLPDRGKELLGRANQIFATNFAEINRFHEERKLDFSNAFRELLEAEIAHHQHVRAVRRDTERDGLTARLPDWCLRLCAAAAPRTRLSRSCPPRSPTLTRPSSRPRPA